LYREFHVEYTEKLNLYFVPYFKEDTVYWDQLKDQMIVKNPDKLQILFSHCAITGSVNNDGSEVKNGLRVSNFKAFDKVYLGHYHNYQQPAVNIYHLSSICQNNFGEDDEKGFWILTDDGEVEFQQSQFKHYKKIVVNLETTSVEKMRELIEENKECVAVDNVRLEFVGTEAKLSGVDRNAYLKMGFDVKTKSTEISTDVNFDEVAVEYTESSIITEFEEFCALNHLEKEEGLQYLINN
jgi:exonuclease SbcD